MPTTSNFGWTTPADTDLVKDGAAAIRTLGNGIDTSFLDLKGGTSGQVLSKASNTDLDFTWVAQDDSNAIQNAIVDAKGDLISATAADTPARLAVGTNGHILTADSTTATGLKWAAPAGGGKLLQLVQGSTTTETTVSTNTYSDSSLTASITPTLATSKILVCITQFVYLYRNTTSNIQTDIRLLRGATAIGDFGSVISGGLLNAGLSGSVTEMAHWVAITYLDEPATTSSTTYKTQVRAANGQIGAQQASTRSTITLMEIGA